MMRMNCTYISKMNEPQLVKRKTVTYVMLVKCLKYKILYILEGHIYM